MADLSIAEADVGSANLIASETLTLPGDSAALKPGDMVKINTSTGEFTLANGSSAAEARVFGMLITGAHRAGDAVTAVQRGTVGLGASLDALTFDDIVYLSDTDGVLADAAGTVSVVVGRVVPHFAGSNTASKLLKLEL